MKQIRKAIEILIKLKKKQSNLKSKINKHKTLSNINNKPNYFQQIMQI